MDISHLTPFLFHTLVIDMILYVITMVMVVLIMTKGLGRREDMGK